MPIRIETTAPRAEGVETVLSESHALMQRLFPPEHNSFLDFDALAAPEITLWAARDDAAILGTVALKAAGEYGEIKSLFVMPEARGHGVAAALLAHAEAEAQARGITLLRLETGDLLEAAGRLYIRAGYVRRGPFGAYEENGTSVFYEKALTACDTSD
ncbi:putative N-acetyltransferase YsnE [Roseivivax sp. THAF40]|uniref:GNAT family N-acetyltransferase n=1 Tax=unclassified Roseivivax TaxID=2639302 RepID=UPI001268D7EC|nr:MULTISPECIES: GNAT family N-acetyltransferase [unclassified Roseivivax]QFS81396.1 putative N-acetyltransferase YsnE [Roseivivax sp. THAF197b]QFT45125.1 putative N-acetyltransferase YsnE [Roseivivax sp. THAF40]